MVRRAERERLSCLPSLPPPHPGTPRPACAFLRFGCPLPFQCCLSQPPLISSVTIRNISTISTTITTKITAIRKITSIINNNRNNKWSKLITAFVYNFPRIFAFKSNLLLQYPYRNSDGSSVHASRHSYHTMKEWLIQRGQFHGYTQVTRTNSSVNSNNNRKTKTKKKATSTPATTTNTITTIVVTTPYNMEGNNDARNTSQAIKTLYNYEIK